MCVKNILLTLSEFTSNFYIQHILCVVDTFMGHVSCANIITFNIIYIYLFIFDVPNDTQAKQ